MRKDVHRLSKGWVRKDANLALRTGCTRFQGTCFPMHIPMYIILPRSVLFTDTGITITIIINMTITITIPSTITITGISTIHCSFPSVQTVTSTAML